MKKIFSILLLALPLAFMTTSCSDDDDLPNVDITVNMSNCKQLDDVVYVVRGQILNIDGISVKNLDGNKPALITRASYFWDYTLLGTSVVAPYGFEIATIAPDEEGVGGTPLGKHLLEIEMPVLAEDKAVATGIVAFVVQVVESEDDIPADAVTPGGTDVSLKMKK